jgi:hypothetical protein
MDYGLFHLTLPSCVSIGPAILKSPFFSITPTETQAWQLWYSHALRGDVH